MKQWLDKMSSFGNMKSSVLACIALLCCAAVQSQTTPDQPVLQSVSVAPVSGDVTITWEMPDPPISPIQVDGFIVFWLNIRSADNYVIETIHDPSVRSYTFHPDAKTLSPPMPDPRKTTLPFTVAAFRDIPWASSLRSDEHYNLQVTNRYDSCRAEISLNWHPYKGWTSHYAVMQIPTGGGIPETVATGLKDTAYTITGIEENKAYTYYIEAIRDDGVTATGYHTSKYTQMPLQPDYISAMATRYNGEGIVEITFLIDPAAQTYAYEMLGSYAPDAPFASLGAFDPVSEQKITLPDIQTRESAYYYRLAAWHVCKNRYTAMSNTVSALWLSMQEKDQVNTLQWNSFIDWGSTANYQLYRKIGHRQETVIANFTDADKDSYQDDISDLPADGDLCYWVTARPEIPASAEQQAISNKICLQPESEIFIPQAFTPNGDGKNDQYRPFFSYDPQEYLFIALDRNGAKIFETKNPNEAWDGRLRNGKPANEDVYGYFIKFKTAKGSVVEKHGTFTLIRPR
jgi:gliding motility-associated-like protein